jgi:para-nitrobenzyl esterase
MKRRSFLHASSLAAVGAAVAPALSFGQSTRAGGPTNIVETTSGRVRGRFFQGVNTFRGIPYGASTAGTNRFMPPRKPQPWTGVRDVNAIGLRAPQLANPRVPEWFIFDRSEPQGEDCLVLNVFTPSVNDARKRPVMVWLHGGGFVAGSSGFTVYEGQNLVNMRDVVLVHLNHRLNLFGFLYLGDLGGERYADGNPGMLDIVAALEWIRDNIASFGGDPNNVTVFGQSGGGSKVSTLFGMPAAKGLFHRAIAMSGTQVRSLTRDQATATAARVLGALNLRPAGSTHGQLDQARLDELHAVPMRRLRDLLNGAGGRGFNWGPVVDGRTLPAHPFDPAASPYGADVPLLIGSTETEVTWNESQIYDPLSDAELREDVSKALRCDPVAADRVIAAYRKGRPRASNLDLYLIIATDASTFRTGTDTQADRKAAQRRAPVYKYYFQWYSPVRGGALRAMHTMDIPFVFENYELASVEVGSGPELKPLGDRMAGAWVAFATTGNPNHPLLPKWPAYDITTRATMVINNEWSVVNDPYGEEKKVVAAVMPPAAAR